LRRRVGFQRAARIGRIHGFGIPGVYSVHAWGMYAVRGHESG
jgi:hypothetical protein